MLMVDGLTWFESLVCQSVKAAIADCTIDVGNERTLLIVSTTKGNIDYLASGDNSQWLPGTSAIRIARRIGVTTEPLVVCNACISGVAAIVTARRLLETGCYDTAIVTGCDVVTHFVVSGFQSLKALSATACRPFDMERTGMNLGEGAATLILSTEADGAATGWQIAEGAVRNDAFHISSPSPKGEGCCSAIRYVTAGVDPSTIGAVNAHGTGTLYNDQMESKAVEAAGLSAVPLNSLKGYFGHTLGASGLLETILTMHAIDHRLLPGTLGFQERGVSGRVNISSHPLAVSHSSFVKIVSGFGGGSAAIYCRRGDYSLRENRKALSEYVVAHRVRMTPHGVWIDERPENVGRPENAGRPENEERTENEGRPENEGRTENAGRTENVGKMGDRMLTAIYKQHIGDYPRYYKMDRLSQLGFVASELLLSQERQFGETAKENPRGRDCTERAVVLFCRTSSVWSDRAYAKTIIPGSEYYPSPSLFVYTLPNVVCGEIALRNGYRGETSFYIMHEKDEAMIRRVVRSTFCDTTLQSMVAGWIDYEDENTFEADFKIIYKV